MLEAIGLSPAESRLYATLVENPRSSADELATQCGVSALLAGRTLAAFARRGLASRLPGRRARYVAVAPDIAIRPLLARHEEELHQVRTAIHELTSSFNLASRYATHPAEQVEVITGSDNIINRAYALQDSAQAMFRNIDKPPYAMRNHADNVERERRMLKSGIDYRTVYDREALAIPGKLRLIQDSMAHGEKARVVAGAAAKIWIADDALALIPIRNGSNSIDAAFILHQSALLDALIALFELEWQRALPLRAAPRPTAHSDDPDELTRELLGLLAGGLTDEAIARALGLGLRTVQRRIHAVMRDLNAVTRFQAGLEARERGWI
ncbi:helix-turn-helix domain-containing protein [Microtetraspora malaysiensis]|uniref:TrmB family transcriptional regulator n=1 Tax=Microtetraspora malaysiensis TaxID=161358 RepID=UPI003D904B41